MTRYNGTGKRSRSSSHIHPIPSSLLISHPSLSLDDLLISQTKKGSLAFDSDWSEFKRQISQRTEASPVWYLQIQRESTPELSQSMTIATEKVFELFPIIVFQGDSPHTPPPQYLIADQRLPYSDLEDRPADLVQPLEDSGLCWQALEVEGQTVNAFVLAKEPFQGTNPLAFSFGSIESSSTQPIMTPPAPPPTQQSSPSSRASSTATDTKSTSFIFGGVQFPTTFENETSAFGSASQPTVTTTVTNPFSNTSVPTTLPTFSFGSTPPPSSEPMSSTVNTAIDRTTTTVAKPNISDSFGHSHQHVSPNTTKLFLCNANRLRSLREWWRSGPRAKHHLINQLSFSSQHTGSDVTLDFEVNGRSKHVILKDCAQRLFNHLSPTLSKHLIALEEAGAVVEQSIPSTIFADIKRSGVVNDALTHIFKAVRRNLLQQDKEVALLAEIIEKIGPTVSDMYDAWYTVRREQLTRVRLMSQQIQKGLVAAGKRYTFLKFYPERTEQCHFNAQPSISTDGLPDDYRRHVVCYPEHQALKNVFTL